jgi:hypothetical protein
MSITRKLLKLKVFSHIKIKISDKFGSDQTAWLISWDLDGKEKLTDKKPRLSFNTITKKPIKESEDNQSGSRLDLNGLLPMEELLLHHSTVEKLTSAPTNMRCHLTRILSFLILREQTWLNSSLIQPMLATLQVSTLK